MGDIIHGGTVFTPTPDLFCRPCYILYNQNIVSLPLVRKVPKKLLSDYLFR